MSDTPRMNRKDFRGVAKETFGHRRTSKNRFSGLLGRLLGLVGLRSCSDSSRPRLLIVGFDAATWTTVETLLEQGALPNLSELIKAGSTVEVVGREGFRLRVRQKA